MRLFHPTDHRQTNVFLYTSVVTDNLIHISWCRSRFNTQPAATTFIGKEINKQKNKGLLAAAVQTEDDKQTEYPSDDSVAEGELPSTVTKQTH